MAIDTVNIDPRSGRKWYAAGLAASLLAIAAAELIWLPAVIVTRGGMQWIEMIDYLYYALSLIPLLWLAGALRRMTASGRRPTWLLVIRALAAALSLCAAASIWLSADHLQLSLIALTTAALFVFADLLASEAASRHAARTSVSGKLRRLPKRSGAWLLAYIVLLLFFVCPTGYSVTYPGMTLNMNRYAHVDGGQAGGTVNGVLVFDRPAVLADRLFAQLLPQYRFEKIPDDEPPLSETYAQVVAMKQDANRVAAAIALHRAGLGGGITPDGVRIAGIVKDSPALGVLQAGDIIDQLNGHSVTAVEDMIGYMTEAVKPGDTVSVSLRRSGKSLTVEASTTKSTQDEKRAAFGITVQTEMKLDAPRDIAFNTYMAHIGGPSHGAMLTLAFIDQLTPGGVTNGLRVAGTGTIEPDGSVGMVGGIPQKAYAVSRTDADVFFVPARGEEAARAAAPQLRIVAVDNIDDILNWLEEQK